jgi:hypothetical protein
MTQFRHTLISALTAAAVLGVTVLAAHSPVGEPKPLDRVVAALRSAR